MIRPVIAITSYVEPASWGAWTDVPAALIPFDYVDQVARAGGLPVVIPPLSHDASADDARALLNRFDGLVLAGGADVEASRYGDDPHRLAQAPRRDRDRAELLLASQARGTVPVLGICRGMQVMVVAAGGRLEQHLPDRLGHLEHGPAPATYGRRTVQTRADSLLRDLLGPSIEVNCYHHQGVRDHQTFDAVALSTDGVVEAIEDTDSGFYLGVQWHPETGRDGRLFEALVQTASARIR